MKRLFLISTLLMALSLNSLYSAPQGTDSTSTAIEATEATTSSQAIASAETPTSAPAIMAEQEQKAPLGTPIIVAIITLIAGIIRSIERPWFRKIVENKIVTAFTSSLRAKGYNESDINNILDAVQEAIKQARRK